MAAELLSFPRLPGLPLPAPYRSAYMTGQLINQERRCSADVKDRGWAMRRGMAHMHGMACMGRGDLEPQTSTCPGLLGLANCAHEYRFYQGSGEMMLMWES